MIQLAKNTATTVAYIYVILFLRGSSHLRLLESLDKWLALPRARSKKKGARGHAIQYMTSLHTPHSLLLRARKIVKSDERERVWLCGCGWRAYMALKSAKRDNLWGLLYIRVQFGHYMHTERPF